MGYLGVAMVSNGQHHHEVGLVVFPDVCFLSSWKICPFQKPWIQQALEFTQLISFGVLMTALSHLWWFLISFCSGMVGGHTRTIQLQGGVGLWSLLLSQHCVYGSSAPLEQWQMEERKSCSYPFRSKQQELCCYWPFFREPSSETENVISWGQSQLLGAWLCTPVQRENVLLPPGEHMWTCLGN